MTRKGLAAVGATLIVMTIACGRESPQEAASTPAGTASTTQEAAPVPGAALSTESIEAERPVRPSPEVVALLEPDPDLDQPLSPEEVKATLEAARGGRAAPRSPRAAATSPDARSDDSPDSPPSDSRAAPSHDSPATSTASAAEEWARLEDAKKKRIERWRERLAATTVYVGNDIWYHRGSCPSLYVYQYDNDRVLRPIYIGRPISLKRAAEASMSRHGECEPASYEFE